MCTQIEKYFCQCSLNLNFYTTTNGFCLLWCLRSRTMVSVIKAAWSLGYDVMKCYTASRTCHWGKQMDKNAIALKDHLECGQQNGNIDFRRIFTIKSFGLKMANALDYNAILLRLWLWCFFFFFDHTKVTCDFCFKKWSFLMLRSIFFLFPVQNIHLNGKGGRYNSCSWRKAEEIHQTTLSSKVVNVL